MYNGPNQPSGRKCGPMELLQLTYFKTVAETAKEEVRQSLLHQQPNVYIAVTNPDLWVDMIAAFMRKHPIFALSSLPQNCAFLLADEADIPKQYAAEYDSRVLFEDRPAVLVHRSHALAQRESVTLQELVDEREFGGPIVDCPQTDIYAPEYARRSHGTADYCTVEAFLDAVLEDREPQLNVDFALKITLPGLVAVQACSQGHVWLDVPEI